MKKTKKKLVKNQHRGMLDIDLLINFMRAVKQENEKIAETSLKSTNHVSTSEKTS